MDERNKSDECSYTKEQATISSTESLKANYGHSVSSNDVENLSLDNGSDDQSYEKSSKLIIDSGSVDIDENNFYNNKKSINDLKKQFFDNQYKNIGLYRKINEEKGCAVIRAVQVLRVHILVIFDTLPFSPIPYK